MRKYLNMKTNNLAKGGFYPGLVYNIWKSGRKLGRKYFSRERIYVDYGYVVGARRSPGVDSYFSIVIRREPCSRFWKEVKVMFWVLR